MLVLDSYINLLRSHDWSYEWSDDPAVFKRGSEERQALRQMQTQCDEDYSIWNEHAPEIYRAVSYTHLTLPTSDLV